MSHTDYSIPYTGLKRIHRVIRKVCAHHNLDVLKRYLIKYPNDIYITDSNGNTPLMLAIRFHKTNVVPILQLLIVSGINPLIKNKLGYDCRMCALIYDCTEAVEYLCEQGLDFSDEFLFDLAVKYSEGSLTTLLNRFTWSQTLKDNALPIVCKRNHSCGSLLEYNAVPNIPFLLKICLGLLYYYQSTGQYKIHNDKVLRNVQYLVRYDPILGYETCIHKMIPPYYHDGLIATIKDCNIDLNSRDSKGNTLLHYTCITHQITGDKLKQYIIENSLDINVQNSINDTPLHHSVNYMTYSNAKPKILLEMGAKLLYNNNGRSPLYYLIIQAPSITTFGIYHDRVIELIDLMIHNGCDLNEAIIAVNDRPSIIHPAIKSHIEDSLNNMFPIKEPAF
jgi:ankyrin repeat protein